MPQLISSVTEGEWNTQGPQTRVQRFFEHYVATVDGFGFQKGSGLEFYAKDAIFHNQNNAVYHGGLEMWAWMKKLFAQFERMKHDILTVWELKNDDGTTRILSQSTRHIWMKGNTTDVPSVSIPLSWICIIGESSNEEAFDGLEYREVWLYWDTALLIPFLPAEATVFKTRNVLQNDSTQSEQGK